MAESRRPTEIRPDKADALESAVFHKRLRRPIKWCYGEVGIAVIAGICKIGEGVKLRISKNRIAAKISICEKGLCAKTSVFEKRVLAKMHIGERGPSTKPNVCERNIVCRTNTCQINNSSKTGFVKRSDIGKLRCGKTSMLREVCMNKGSHPTKASISKINFTNKRCFAKVG